MIASRTARLNQRAIADYREDSDSSSIERSF